ncbi:MAG TPA: RodZ domain-containing protein [Gaiellaceae bacterium]|nr:RodZ domain-containing protein [Gaiellaceae bacterium]
MFEIGSSLHEARVRRGLELSQVERDTKIRGKYLAALEEDRFDALPGPAYARGFLRTYADYLGLEGQRFVDEYHSRFAPPDETVVVAPVRIQRRRFALRPSLGAAAVIAAVLLGLIAWQLTSRGGGNQQATSHPLSHTATTPPTTTPAPPPSRPAKPAPPTPALARVTLAATKGPCWLSVHVGSAAGAFVWEGTLEPGRSVHFVSKRLWIRIGAPWNLDAKLNGKPTTLPQTTGDVLVTARRVTQAPT